MSVKIKICGLREVDNITALEQFEPDYMGFIFYRRSKRYVGENFDFEQIRSLNSNIKKVGVYVNAGTDEIISRAETYRLDFVQLHGDETPDTCKILAKEGLKVIKAFSPDDKFDFKQVNSYKPSCKYFLFDTKGEGYGGTGKAFNWEILKRYDNEVPFFLSGGIDLENAKRISKFDQLNIHAVDVNSGFEIYPGLKDIEKIKRLFKLFKSKSST